MNEKSSVTQRDTVNTEMNELLSFWIYTSNSSIMHSDYI